MHYVSIQNMTANVCRSFIFYFYVKCNIEQSNAVPPLVSDNQGPPNKVKFLKQTIIDYLKNLNSPFVCLKLIIWIMWEDINITL